MAGGAWEEHEVYKLTMDSPLSDLHGVGSEGSPTLRVFRHAGYTKIGDLYPTLNQEVQVRASAEALAVQDGTADAGHWRALATYCVGVIRRVRSAEAQPTVPEHFLCPILHTCMEDPVVTRHGYSYERYAIERAANDPDASKRLDPVACLPISGHDLFPNRALKAAIEYYQGHMLRFSIPYRLRRE
jgi:hypothetical protein